MGSAGAEPEGQRSCSHGRGKERKLWEEEEFEERGKRENRGMCKEGRGTKEKEREGEEMKMVKGDRKEENRASKRERPFHFLHMQYSSAP